MTDRKATQSCLGVAANEGDLKPSDSASKSSCCWRIRTICRLPSLDNQLNSRLKSINIRSSIGEVVKPVTMRDTGSMCANTPKYAKNLGQLLIVEKSIRA